jgi:hypothetical protein
VTRIEPLYSFDFDDDGTLNQDINKEGMADLDSVINDSNWRLTLESQPCLGEFDRKTLFVRGFGQSAAELCMNPYRRADDRVCDLIDIHEAISAFSASNIRSYDAAEVRA